MRSTMNDITALTFRIPPSQSHALIVSFLSFLHRNFFHVVCRVEKVGERSGAERIERVCVNVSH